MKSNIILKVLRYSLTVAMIFTGVGCNATNDSSTISGTVTDLVGVPVVGAVVSSVDGDDTTTTDSDGDFSIEIPRGSGEILINGEGMNQYRGPAIPGEDGRVHFAMEDEGEGPCQRMDVNEDGEISQDEWIGPEDVFVTIDADGDGILTSDELEAAKENHERERRGPGRGPRMDADEDGVISQDEWLGSEAVFEAIDTDDDGVLSEEEIHIAFRQNAQAPESASAYE